MSRFQKTPEPGSLGVFVGWDQENKAWVVEYENYADYVASKTKETK